MFDRDTYNYIEAEERGYDKWFREQKNRILRMTNTERKQKEWNKLNPKLAVEGLTEEQLTQPY